MNDMTPLRASLACLFWALLIGAFVAWLLAVAVAGAR